MRRFLVVGCGGSGGITLAYMMDQLRSELAAFGVNKLPKGWQFVHIDVPSAPDPLPDLRNVFEQGGKYIPCAPQGGSYPVLDDAVSSQLLGHPGAFGEIASWAPRSPENVTVPLTEGAGQYRALGRMITIAQVRNIYEGLTESWLELSRVETASELAELGRTVPGLGAFQNDDSPCVLVVSSMSGGSGSSMVLDVCRLLSMVGVPTQMVGLFLFSADVFDKLPQATQKRGVRSNGLAMLGEIVASQTGSSVAHDETLLSALGLQSRSSTQVPFARIFPVGRFIGSQQTEFGDGQPSTVCRGLARGLAALMMSGPASHQFIRYDLTNGAPLDEHGDYLGWGTPNRSWVPWGSFGYACLSLGRERYREYAAQRIARGALDRLITGHLRPGATASGTDQLKALVASQWSVVCEKLRLPADTAAWTTWLTKTALPDADYIARQIIDTQITPNLPVPAQGTEAVTWLAALRPQLTLQRAKVSNAATEAAYQRVYQWQREQATAIVSATEEAIARFGLPYAQSLLRQISEHLDETVLKPAQRDSKHGNIDGTALPDDTQQRLVRLKGAIRNGQQFLDTIIDDLRNPLRTLVLGRSCGMLEQACAGLIEDVLSPLGSALTEALKVLTAARDDTGRTNATQDNLAVGLAHLATDLYTAWPADPSDGATAVVPARFAHATNEVLLTKSTDFEARFRTDIVAAVPKEVRDGEPQGEEADFLKARRTVIGMVVEGIWPAPQGPAGEGGLIRQTNETWYSRGMLDVPGTNERSTPNSARFAVRVAPAEVLERARAFVSRGGESFDDFCRVSLSDYVAGKGKDAGSAGTRSHREVEVVRAFSEALTLALPLAGVSADVVTKIYATDLSFRYKFSEVPFAGDPLAAALARVLDQRGVDGQFASRNLEEALATASEVTKVDIFGSYPIYLPVVFRGILEPAADQWAQESHSPQGEFWRWRRARPLAAALPMGDAERIAMVKGWLVGQLVGQIRIPEKPPFEDPVRIWDPEKNDWTAFPDPLLTPPRTFSAMYDWLPAVLESIIIAIAQSPKFPVMSSMRPYQLLRELYGSNIDAPGNGGIIPPNCDETIEEWMRSGKTASGYSSRAAGDSFDARAAAALEWLNFVGELATQYVPPTDKPGGGAFSIVKTRAQASAAPIFRDLAPDFIRATNELGELVDEIAKRPRRQLWTEASSEVASGTQIPSPGTVF